jgi:hypothetical protein
MAQYSADVADLAAWIESKGPTRWWTVDGEYELSGELSLPTSGPELAAALRKRGGRITVEAASELPAGEHLTPENFDQVASRDEFGYVVTVRWLDEGRQPEAWDIVEDTLTSDLVRADTSPNG